MADLSVCDRCGGEAFRPETRREQLVRWWAALVGVPVAAMVGAFLWSMATAVGRGRDVL